MLIVITVASFPEPFIRVGKNPVLLHHTERDVAGFIEGSF